MKIKNRLSFVKILTEDLGEYTDIALLVDKESFLEKIEGIRSKYHLNYDYPVSDVEKIYFEFGYKLLTKEHKLKYEFSSEVEKIRKNFSMPPHFTKVIESSIIYGVVGESDYSRAYLEEQIITPLKNPYEIPDIKYCIVIHAGTRKEDIERVCNEFNEKKRINFKGTQQEKDDYMFGYGIDLSLAKIRHTQASIIKVRDWYIQRQNGETPLRIALKIRGYTYKRYQELLKKYKHNFKLEEKEDEKYQKELRFIYSLRDTIKTQLRKYPSLVQASVL